MHVTAKGDLSAEVERSGAPSTDIESGYFSINTVLIPRESAISPRGRIGRALILLAALSRGGATEMRKRFGDALRSQLATVTTAK